tara:strand:+ start:18758 stop:19681 length:924 start_codon:yes stop_codon:yes gene_type:complete
MPIFKPKGNFQGDVIDPEKLSQEWVSAKQIVDNATSWQFLSQEQSGMDYSNLAKKGAGVSVLQKQIHSYIGAGRGNRDGPFLKYENASAVKGYKPWKIPYLKGFQEVWDGDLRLSWTATSPELVLIGYSTWAYRLSSESENTNNIVGESALEAGESGGFGLTTDEQFEDAADTPAEGSIQFVGGDFYSDDVRIRIKLGLKLDGFIVDGSGPGTNVGTNGPEMIFGAGSREKGIVTSSQSVHMINAGTHTITPVAAQGPSTERNIYEFYDTKEMMYGSSGKNQENLGTAIVNSRVYVIRFPRGKMLGD